MSKFIITKNAEGKIVGLAEKDQAALNRWRKVLAEMEAGECAAVETWFDRRQTLQGLHHKMLHAVWDAQEAYTDPDEFRGAVYCAVGYCTVFPGLDGKAVRIPKSTAYSVIDDADFATIHEKCEAWLRSEHGTRVLWPHLSDRDQMEMIATILEQFSDENRRLYNEAKNSKPRAAS